jgi:hypothetical protein
MKKDKKRISTRGFIGGVSFFWGRVPRGFPPNHPCDLRISHVFSPSIGPGTAASSAATPPRDPKLEATMRHGPWHSGPCHGGWEGNDGKSMGKTLENDEDIRRIPFQGTSR